ncbi:MAG: adenine phosphoribosyltransferase [Chloroflexota bacterium]
MQHSSDPTDSGTDDDFKRYIQDVKDFPKEGIVFRDITPLLKDGAAFHRAVNKIASRFADERIDLVCSVEARGFILGAAIAHALGAGFVPVRKLGKLPRHCHQAQYNLEYGTDTLEIHQDAIAPGQRVLIVDDVLATGGTAEAVVNLVRKIKGEIVCVAVLIELRELKGRKKLAGVPSYSLMQYQ